MEKLKDKFTEYYYNIIQYDKPDIIKGERNRLKERIAFIDRAIEIDPVGVRPKLVAERRICVDIEYILGLIQDNLEFEAKYIPSKDYFMFILFSIFLFMIPLAFNQINYSNDQYILFSDNWKFIKMPFAGLLIAIFFIILKDFAYMLHHLKDNE